MNRPAFVFLLWGLELAVLALVGLFLFDFDSVEPPVLLGGAAATFVVLAGYITGRRVGAERPEEPSPSPDVSPVTAWLAVSLLLLAVSVELGPWLALISAGMLTVGVFGLARELTAQRRLEARIYSEAERR
jgi:hypothetical protein